MYDRCSFYLLVVQAADAVGHLGLPIAREASAGREFMFATCVAGRVQAQRSSECGNEKPYRTLWPAAVGWVTSHVRCVYYFVIVHQFTLAWSAYCLEAYRPIPCFIGARQLSAVTGTGVLPQPGAFADLGNINMLGSPNTQSVAAAAPAPASTSATSLATDQAAPAQAPTSLAAPALPFAAGAHEHCCVTAFHVRFAWRQSTLPMTVIKTIIFGVLIVRLCHQWSVWLSVVYKFV